jgi:ActR/RegA family two-component response regulator
MRCNWPPAPTNSKRCSTHSFDYAVVDLKLGTASGLTCVQMLSQNDPATCIVVLTGFASIATAVEAIKLGAAHYLAKPANTDDIEEAFAKREGNPEVPVEGRKTSIKTWNGNISTPHWPNAISTFPRPRAGWGCIAARWPANWKSGS